MNVTYPVTILSDLHLGHPASYLTDPRRLTPLFRDAATVVFNGDSVEMLWVGNRDHAQEQLDRLAQACLDAGARPVFLTGNHDPVVSSASFLDLCDGEVLVTHGDILFPAIAPWSPEARIVGPAHDRFVAALDEEARTDLTERLIAAKRATLQLEMHEPRRSGGRWAGLAMAARETWPPWRPLWIVQAWMQTPGLADKLAQQYRPAARCVVVGHTHYAGVWQRGGRVIVNTGSFLPFSGRAAVRLTPERLEVRAIVSQNDEWVFGPLRREMTLGRAAQAGRHA
jgi:UDP-2,3-diacylglucosamine pyrophosphatase LpxH